MIDKRGLIFVALVVCVALSLAAIDGRQYTMQEAINRLVMEDFDSTATDHIYIGSAYFTAADTIMLAFPAPLYRYHIGLATGTANASVLIAFSYTDGTADTTDALYTALYTPVQMYFERPPIDTITVFKSGAGAFSVTVGGTY